MICPNCKADTHDLLACPACTWRRSDAGILTQQAEYFIRARRGEWPFLTCRTTDGHNHVRMFGQGNEKAFCGQPLTIEKRKLGRVDWGDEERWKFLCAGCRIEVRRIMEDIPQ